MESVYDTKLTSKEKIIDELQARIAELTKGKQEKEISDDRLIQTKNAEIGELQAEISQRNTAITNLNVERGKAQKQIEQFEQDLEEQKLKAKTYGEKAQTLERDIQKLKEENIELKVLNQKNKSQLE